MVILFKFFEIVWIHHKTSTLLHIFIFPSPAHPKIRHITIVPTDPYYIERIPEVFYDILSLKNSTLLTGVLIPLYKKTPTPKVLLLLLLLLLFKGCSGIFTPLLTYIFNLSLTSVSLPWLWKQAAIVPVFKKGNSTIVSNYIPISILIIFP
jgi:hypothetical protein